MCFQVVPRQLGRLKHRGKPRQAGRHENRVFDLLLRGAGLARLRDVGDETALVLERGGDADLDQLGDLAVQRSLGVARVAQLLVGRPGPGELLLEVVECPRHGRISFAIGPNRIGETGRNVDVRRTRKRARAE